MKKYTIDIDKQIGEKIKTLRRTFNITQSVLGERLGISAQQINKYETGADRVSVSTLYKIANVLHCNIEILLPTDAKNRAKMSTTNILKVAESSAVYKTNSKHSNSNALELLKLFFKMSKDEQLELIQQLKNKVEEK